LVYRGKYSIYVLKLHNYFFFGGDLGNRKLRYPRRYLLTTMKLDITPIVIAKIKL